MQAAGTLRIARKPQNYTKIDQKIFGWGHARVISGGFCKTDTDTHNFVVDDSLVFPTEGGIFERSVGFPKIFGTIWV